MRLLVIRTVVLMCRGIRKGRLELRCGSNLKSIKFIRFKHRFVDRKKEEITCN